MRRILLGVAALLLVTWTAPLSPAAHTINCTPVAEQPDAALYVVTDQNHIGPSGIYRETNIFDGLQSTGQAACGHDADERLFPL